MCMYLYVNVFMTQNNNLLKDFITMDEDMFDLDRFVDEQDRYSYDDSFDIEYDDEYGSDDHEYDQ